MALPRLPVLRVPRSVRARTTLGAAFALALLVVLSGVVIERLVVSQVRRAADATLQEQAVDRAQLLASGAAPGTVVNVIGDEVLAAVISESGQVLALQGAEDGTGLADLPIGVSTIDVVLIESGHGESEEDPHQERIRAAVAQAADGSRVVVGNEGDGVKATINTVRLILILGGPLIAAAGAAVAWFVTGRALAPVHRLRDDLEGVTRVGGRVGEPATDDEIQSLAETTNELLARLENQSAARRRFVADASHELKSPIANARVLVDTGSTMDSEVLRNRVGRELDRLQSLVDDLLFLARTDETTASQPTVFDLDDVLFDEAERAAVRTDISIDAGGVQPARVLADPSEVARAVRNLVENGVRHAKARVGLSVEEADGFWLVAVTDDGPGVPAADRDRIFERFTRLDHDRARAEGGTGLGLSIVAAIATRNGGTVAVGDRRDTASAVGAEDAVVGGARFELALPAAPQARRPDPQ